jgi:hypothetical protein
MNASAEVNTTNARRLVTGREIAALLDRPASVRYLLGFPAPLVSGRGPKPNLWDPAAVLAWAAANPPQPSRWETGLSSGRTAPKPKAAPAPEPVCVDGPTRYTLARLRLVNGLLLLPDEMDNVRSLRRDFDDGPCRKPRACARFRTFLKAGQAKADGQDIDPALLAAEAARDRRHGAPPAPAPVVGRLDRVKARREAEPLFGWMG